MTYQPVHTDVISGRPRHPRWSLVRRLALTLGLLVVGMPALCQTTAPSPKPFVMTVDSDSDNYGSRWAKLIFTELFKRLGMPFRVESYSLARRTALLEEGMTDGESSRIYSYGENRPYLVRVEESLIDFSFALYSANPAVHLERLEDLRASSYLVEHRRGILLCEKTLHKWVPAAQISDVLATQQGLKKLQTGRTDLYCDLEVYVRQELMAPEFKGKTSIRKVISIGDAIPTYTYLHKKHAALAPRMAAIIKQMKAEGLIEAYRQQVEQELGWSD